MTRKYWLNLGPSLLVGLGIIVGTLVAKVAAGFGWWVMAGPVLLAAAVVCADLVEARLKGKRSAPSYGALMIAGSFLAAGFIVTLRDPSLVKLLIPVIGPAAWITILLRFDIEHKACKWI